MASGPSFSCLPGADIAAILLIYGFPHHPAGLCPQLCAAQAGAMQDHQGGAGAQRLAGYRHPEAGATAHQQAVTLLLVKSH